MLKDFFTKFKIPIVIFCLFTAIGSIIGFIIGIRYFFLFAGIGFFELNSRIFIIYYPKARQVFRLSVQLLIGGFLLFWLGIVKGVNFQFSQIIFDTYSWVVTGALIQFVVARLVLPFFLGNAFCSRACWSGFFFEMTNTKKQKNKIERSNFLAWAYIVFLIVLSVYVAFKWDPGMNENFRRSWIIYDNLIIVSIGFILTLLVGSRTYCRLLCPFLTISSIIAPYSLFKITPVKANDCNGCKRCNKACPMLIDVEGFAKTNTPVNDAICIVCERCVSSCNKEVLKLTSKRKS